MIDSGTPSVFALRSDRRQTCMSSRYDPPAHDRVRTDLAPPHLVPIHAAIGRRQETRTDRNGSGANAPLPGDDEECNRSTRSKICSKDGTSIDRSSFCAELV